MAITFGYKSHCQLSFVIRVAYNHQSPKGRASSRSPQCFAPTSQWRFRGKSFPLLSIPSYSLSTPGFSTCFRPRFLFASDMFLHDILNSDLPPCFCSKKPQGRERLFFLQATSRDWKQGCCLSLTSGCFFQ
jgi:hypothetical protein